MADDPEYASSNEEEQQQVGVTEDGRSGGVVVAEDDEVTMDQLLDEEQEGFEEDANNVIVCDGCQLDVAQYPFCPLTGQPHLVEEPEEEELPCNSCGLILSSTPFCAATGQPHLTESRNMQQQQTSGNTRREINYPSSSSASPGPREIRSERSKREDKYNSTSSSRLGGGGPGDAPLHVKELYARKREQFHQQQRTGHSASHLTSSSGRTGARATDSGAEATEEILGGERGFGIFLSDNPVLHSKENQRGGSQSSSGEGVQNPGGVYQEEQQVSNNGPSPSLTLGDSSSSAIAELLHRPNGGTSSFKGRLGNEDQRKKRGVSKEEAIKEFQSLIDRSKQEQVQDATYKVKYEKQEEKRMMKQNPLRYVLSIPGRLLHSVVGTEAGFTPSMALILTIFFLWNIRRAVNLMYGGADGRDDDLPGDATMEEADRMTQLWQEP